MKISLVLTPVLILSLAACNTPSPPFMGIPATSVNLGGSTFDVRVRDYMAEALWTNQDYKTPLGLVYKRAEQAIEQASGCDAAEFAGEYGMFLALLDCGNGPPVLPTKPVAPNFDCDIWEDRAIWDDLPTTYSARCYPD